MGFAGHYEVSGKETWHGKEQEKKINRRKLLNYFVYMQHGLVKGKNTILNIVRFMFSRAAKYEFDYHYWRVWKQFNKYIASSDW